MQRRSSRAAFQAKCLTLLTLTLMHGPSAEQGARGDGGWCIDWPHGRREATPGHRWTAWARSVIHYPWAATLAAVAVLATLGLAANAIQISEPQADALAVPAAPPDHNLGQPHHIEQLVLARSGTSFSSRALTSQHWKPYASRRKWTPFPIKRRPILGDRVNTNAPRGEPGQTG
jgi:hypothetical protein